VRKVYGKGGAGGDREVGYGETGRDRKDEEKRRLADSLGVLCGAVVLLLFLLLLLPPHCQSTTQWIGVVQECTKIESKTRSEDIKSIN
jgi:hypothetical protein